MVVNLIYLIIGFLLGIFSLRQVAKAFGFIIGGILRIFNRQCRIFYLIRMNKLNLICRKKNK